MASSYLLGTRSRGKVTRDRVSIKRDASFFLNGESETCVEMGLDGPAQQVHEFLERELVRSHKDL